MVLTDEVGRSVEVICCVAWSFSTSFIASVKVCGPFLYTLVAMVCAFFKPFRKIPYGSGVIIEFTSVSFPFKSMNICC